MNPLQPAGTSVGFSLSTAWVPPPQQPNVPIFPLHIPLYQRNDISRNFSSFGEITSRAGSGNIPTLAHTAVLLGKDLASIFPRRDIPLREEVITNDDSPSTTSGEVYISARSSVTSLPEAERLLLPALDARVGQSKNTRWSIAGGDVSLREVLVTDGASPSTASGDVYVTARSSLTSLPDTESFNVTSNDVSNSQENESSNAYSNDLTITRVSDFNNAQNYLNTNAHTEDITSTFTHSSYDASNVDNNDSTNALTNNFKYTLSTDTSNAHNDSSNGFRYNRVSFHSHTFDTIASGSIQGDASSSVPEPVVGVSLANAPLAITWPGARPEAGHQGDARGHKGDASSSVPEPVVGVSLANTPLAITWPGARPEAGHQSDARGYKGGASFSLLEDGLGFSPAYSSFACPGAGHGDARRHKPKVVTLELQVDWPLVNVDLELGFGSKEQSSGESDLKLKVTPGSDPEPDPGPGPEPKPGFEPDEDWQRPPKRQPDTKSELDPEPDPESNPESVPLPEPESDSESELEQGPEPKRESRPDFRRFRCKMCYCWYVLFALLLIVKYLREKLHNDPRESSEVTN